MRKIQEKIMEHTMKATASSVMDKVLGGGGEEEGLISNQPRGSDGSSDEEKGGMFGKVTNLFRSRKNSASSSKSSDGGDSSAGEEGKDEANEDSDNPMDHAGLREAKADKNFGKKKFNDSTLPSTWHVLVRVIEGRDVVAGALRVRAALDGSQKATRTCTDGRPKWKQNLTFSQKDTTLEALGSSILNIKLTRVGRIREEVLGVFDVSLGAIVHSPEMIVASKWIALRGSGEYEDEETENCGFLKVSFCIYGANDSPPNLNDDKASEEVWSAAQLQPITMRIRMFRLHQIAEELINAVGENSKSRAFAFFVRVRLGNQTIDTAEKMLHDYKLKEFDAKVVDFLQELFIPLDWPTVIGKIKFELYMKKGSKQRCLGQASLPLRAMYEPGESGFMPTFGPSYVNFFGHEELLRLKWRKEKKVIGEDEGSKYLARLLCAVECVEYMGETPLHSDIDQASQEYANQFEEMNRYNVFCTFFACNMINPLFASDSVSFHVSMGEHGSHSFDYSSTRSSTLGSMPNHDGSKYFYMPWGNHKPQAEVPCLWENVDTRMQRANAILKVVSMLNTYVDAIRRGGENACEAASLVIEAMDHLEDMLERLEKHHNSDTAQTELDRQWEKNRERSFREIIAGLNHFRYDVSHQYEEIPLKAERLLTRIRDSVLSLAEDAQISIPNITIKMVAGQNVVGYAQIKASEVMYNENEALCGEGTARMRAIHLKWPTKMDRKQRQEQFPATLHCRLWFGRRRDQGAWVESCQPAETKQYLEVFTYQKRSLLARNTWKPFGKHFYSDEKGSVDMEMAARREVYGWELVGNWTTRSSQDMWKKDDGGKKTVVDRYWEVETRTAKGWDHHKYSDFNGEKVEKSLRKPPEKGWEYIEKWTSDKQFNTGDKHGFVYAIADENWDAVAGTVEKEERPHHMFRRRCIARTRKALEYNHQMDDINAFAESLGERHWEFAKNMNAGWHASDIEDAEVRRRRFIVEVEREKDLPRGRQHENFFLPRLFESHMESSNWELRCYIMWAKDLLPFSKDKSRTFVRVTFLTKCQRTRIVNDCNPVWNETLIFENVLIPGGNRQINMDPPTILVEIRGERDDDSEMFLGRFETTPQVLCQPSSDPRATPKWNTLKFDKGKTRGCLLASFELYNINGSNKDKLPSKPAVKKEKDGTRFDGRMAVPGEVLPPFEKYRVQFLCWGVRNLSKYRLLPVRRPFVELILGSCKNQTTALLNTATDPNFTDPIFNLDGVDLPSSLELCPPLVLNVYDTRSFNRKPLIGVCYIQNFAKYMRRIKKKTTRTDKGNWKKYDAAIKEAESQMKGVKMYQTIQHDGEPRLDWWSKYYASTGNHSKAPGFEESGIEHLTVFGHELEKVRGYDNFADFLETFNIVKSAKGSFDDPEEKEKTGELKGKLCFSRKKSRKHHESMDPPGVEFTGMVDCLLRVYVVEAVGLQATRKNGLCDPYILVRCGKQKLNLKKQYIPGTTNPQFGQLIELDVTVPLDKDLTVTVMDRRHLRSDEEIGSTRIDLENRLLSKWRGTVGLPRQYTIQGELAWRDQLVPMRQLENYCKKMQLAPPKILKGTDFGIEFLGVKFWYQDVLKALQKDDEHYVKNMRQKAGGDEDDELDGQEEKEEKGGTRKSGKSEKEDDEEEPQQPNHKGDGDGATPDSPHEDVYKIRHEKKEELTTEEILVKRRDKRELLMGRPLHCVALYIMHMMNLVPEHVETRTLTTAMGGNASCGEVKMFVDLFPKQLGKIPYPLDITPRRPDRYQLRVAVFNVSNAIPIRRSFDDPVCDLYVKVFVNGLPQDSTDVHHRSLDGCGEFNWRFVIDVDFNPWEKKVVAYKKERIMRKATETMVEPTVIFEIWDKQSFRKDQMLGQLVMPIEEFMLGVPSPANLGIYTKKTRFSTCGKCCSRKCCLLRCCLCLKDSKCGCKFREKKKEPMPKAPKYVEPDSSDHFVSLFDARVLRGWWPVTSSNLPDEQKMGKAAMKKKNDDFDENAEYITGMIEMEISLLNKSDADLDPVGKKRKEPNHDPYLPKPQRTTWNYFWLTSRVKPFAHWCWHKCGIQIVIWLLLALLVFIFVYAIVYNWPVVLIELVKLIFLKRD